MMFREIRSIADQPRATIAVPSSLRRVRAANGSGRRLIDLNQIPARVGEDRESDVPRDRRLHREGHAFLLEALDFALNRRALERRCRNAVFHECGLKEKIV